MRRVLRSETGDTLVEVILGLAILTVVLITSFSTASAAFRLSQDDRERTVAANILQGQAEALRNFRDTRVNNWATPGTGVYALIKSRSSNFSSSFHMERRAGVWVPISGALTGSSVAQKAYTNNYDKFTITITPTPDPSNIDDRINFDIKATWSGSGPIALVSTISTSLVNATGLACRGNTAGTCVLP